MTIKKILMLVLIITLMIGLTGCEGTESVCPITLVRISDGVRIRMDMHREEIENILESIPETDRGIHPQGFDDYVGLYGDANDYIMIIYNARDENSREKFISIRSHDWAVNGIAIGDDIQGVIQTITRSNQFEYFYHDERMNSFDVFFEDEYSETSFHFLYDEERKVRLINLFFLYD